MLSVEEAKARILSALKPTGTEIVGLADAWGRVLAAPVEARLTQPPADVSAMDGYALRASDTYPPRPLAIVGESPAGRPSRVAIGEGQAIRLFTGSVVPNGADTILLQEDAVRDGADGHAIRCAEPWPAHQAARGQDFTSGDVLIEAGRRLGARDLGLARRGEPSVADRASPAPASRSWRQAMKSSCLAKLSVKAGSSVRTAHALAAFIRAAGGEPCLLPVARDDAGAIADAAAAASRMDMLVTTGGRQRW